MMFFTSILSLLLSINFLLAFSTEGISAMDRITARASARHHLVHEEGSTNLLDMFSIFVQEAYSKQNLIDNRGIDHTPLSNSFNSIASLIGAFIQLNSADVNKNANVVAMQILSGLGNMITNDESSKSGLNNGNYDDRTLMGDIIEYFSQNSENKSGIGSTSIKKNVDDGFDISSILNIVSLLIEYKPTNSKQKKHISLSDKSSYADINNFDIDEGKFLLDSLPLVTKVIQSFYGQEGQQTEQKHRGHAWALPPFLEYLHVLWDHFTKSELGNAVYEKSGVHHILKMFKNNDDKLDYDRLFESLYNQSFRRRWIKSATMYFADWISYFSNPDIYLKYFHSGQILLNNFLKSQGFPRNTLFDSRQACNTISNLLDHIVEKHLKLKIDSRQYVIPAIHYVEDLLKLGRAKGLLQFNATKISDRLTHTLNLETIEPVLKIHRAYRFIIKQPKCDRYVLCKLNTVGEYSAEEDRGLITGVSPKIIKVGSTAAAFFISTKTGTPFWSLLNAIIATDNCEIKYPANCNDFQKGEAKVITEYIHNEL